MKVAYGLASVVLMFCAVAIAQGRAPMPAGQPPAIDPKPLDPRPEPVLQIALLLDTSNSMDGLINQARTQLWKVVNEFGNCRKDGVAPKLQVALYEYGNNGLAAGEGYIRMVLPLTSDLDLVSEKLWSLKTNGGSEYCGQVIHNAIAELAWTREKGAYRAIFIAGNEPFTQGSVDYRESCAAAVARGVIVNTIHCGPEADGREGQWDRGARLGEGRFMNIDQDRACVAIVAPQDDELVRLSGELNKTYIAYGDAGRDGLQRQQMQDAAATTQPGSGAAAERAVAKGSGNYTNANWDLVDARRDNKVKLDDLDASALPQEMRAMSPAERDQYLTSQAEKRTAIQKQIADLNTRRSAYIQAEQKKQGAAATDTLDTAIHSAVREQLQAKDYKAE